MCNAINYTRDELSMNLVRIKAKLINMHYVLYRLTTLENPCLLEDLSSYSSKCLLVNRVDHGKSGLAYYSVFTRLELGKFRQEECNHSNWDLSRHEVKDIYL